MGETSSNNFFRNFFHERGSWGLHLHLRCCFPPWGVFIPIRIIIFKRLQGSTPYMGVNPKIMGKPAKSSIELGFSIINHPFWRFSPYFWKHTFVTKMGVKWGWTYKWPNIFFWGRVIYNPTYGGYPLVNDHIAIAGMTSPFSIGSIHRLNPGPPFSSNRYVSWSWSVVINGVMGTYKWPKIKFEQLGWYCWWKKSCTTW